MHSTWRRAMPPEEASAAGAIRWTSPVRPRSRAMNSRRVVIWAAVKTGIHGRSPVGIARSSVLSAIVHAWAQACWSPPKACASPCTAAQRAAVDGEPQSTAVRYPAVASSSACVAFPRWCA